MENKNKFYKFIYFNIKKKIHVSEEYI